MFPPGATFDRDLFAALLRSVWERARFVLGDEAAVVLLRRVVDEATRTRPVLAACGLMVDVAGFSSSDHDEVDDDGLREAACSLLDEILATLVTMTGPKLADGIVEEAEAIARVRRVLALRARLRAAP